MSNSVAANDFAGASADLLELIVAESDKRIATQLQIMIAADARANGVLAAATALAAAGLAVAVSQFDPKAVKPLFAAALVFSTTTGASAWCALWALWPTGVDAPGWSPRLFKADIAAAKSFARIQAEVACKNQEKISDNELCNARLSRRAKSAMTLLAGAPLAGASAASFYALGIYVGVVSAAILTVLAFGIARSIRGKKSP